MRESPYDFDGDDWQPAESARRFESGTPNMMGIQALDASLGLFEEIGLSFVNQRLADNTAHLIEALDAISDIELLTPRDPTKRAGIVTFRHPDMAGRTVHPNLMRAGVICAARAGGIRFAPHFYTPTAVIDRAIDTFLQTIQ